MIIIENKNEYTQVIIRPLSILDFDKVLQWSKNGDFCSANGWEKNRNHEELYQWWFRCVNNEATDFIRMGIEFNKKIIGYVDVANIRNNTGELGIAIGERDLDLMLLNA